MVKMPPTDQLVKKFERSIHVFVQLCEQAGPEWSGLFIRILRARALRSSLALSGFEVSVQDALAAVDNEDPIDCDKASFQALAGYQSAISFLLTRCKSSDFRFNKEALLAVQFMICEHEKGAHAGSFRIGARSSAIHSDDYSSGPDGGVHDTGRDKLLLDVSSDEPAIGRAARARHDILRLRPFSRGNGRVARCLHTAILSRHYGVDPAVVSIDEYIAQNAPYVRELFNLALIGHATAWFEYFVEAHARHMQRVLREATESARIHEKLLGLVATKGLPARGALALLQSIMGLDVRNSSYKNSADISINLASRDLKSLVDARLLVAKGDKRGRSYQVADDLLGYCREYRKVSRE